MSLLVAYWESRGFEVSEVAAEYVFPCLYTWLTKTKVKANLNTRTLKQFAAVPIFNQSYHGRLSVDGHAKQYTLLHHSCRQPPPRECYQFHLAT